jgi:hypothetical protein
VSNEDLSLFHLFHRLPHFIMSWPSQFLSTHNPHSFPKNPKTPTTFSLSLFLSVCLSLSLSLFCRSPFCCSGQIPPICDPLATS